MNIITFKVSELARLVLEIDQACQFKPSAGDQFDPAMHIGGVVKDQHGNEEGDEGFTFPDWYNIDRTKVRPALMLVADEGVCMITNADLPGTPITRGTAIYATGFDPNKDHDVLERKAALFGWDDSVFYLSPDIVREAQSRNLTSLNVHVSDNKIEFLLEGSSHA